MEDENTLSEPPSEVELLDLPEPVLLHILSYLKHDTLRQVVANVNFYLRKLAHTPSLWRNATLSYTELDCWDDACAEGFINNILETPHLQQLRVEFGPENLAGEDTVQVWRALLDSPVRLRGLCLISHLYVPEAHLLLRRHPEVEELELVDSAVDDEVTERLASEVASLAHHLTMLDLSRSRLLSLRCAGALLAGGQQEHAAHAAAAQGMQAAEDAVLCPAGGEPELPRGPGLTRFKYVPTESTKFELESIGEEETVSANLASLLRAHRHSLCDVDVDDPSKEVFAALAQCDRLQDLGVTSDGQGTATIDLFRALSARRPPLRHLRRLRLRLGPSGEASYPSLTPPRPPTPRVVADLLAGVATLPELEVLEVRGLDGTAHFPGFLPLRPLLKSADGPLRELHLSSLSPVGREAFDELGQLAPRRLRLLVVADCECSPRGDFAKCRDRVSDRLQRSLPDLELQIEGLNEIMDDRYDYGFLPVNTCSCETRRPRR